MKQHDTMKDLPDSERPYEKCMRFGPEVLSDAELLAVLIRTGSKKKSAVDLANQILRMGPDGILNLTRVTREELTGIHGIGCVKAVLLLCATELSKRMARAQRIGHIRLNSPSSVAEYYMEQLRHERVENVLVCMFDVRGALLGDRLISRGTPTSSLIAPSEIFRSALLAGADHIIVLHNHPSGDPSPSREDRNVTERLDRAGRLIGLTLADHIIIGDQKYYSFAENRLLGCNE